ncbi:Histidine kinase [Verrucomicrobium sp. GAS474]|uniref:sensor histidine kinase n=1 Tax=Verrucomicrobium sp. GAS474 TaxID=1882831 RepID=UPI00087CA6C8|nr:histidine kinase [Verrucomicrobium sp. GAS474]SDT90122.1 Histidine kinase [Verrucomicrobium sp. GAS474]
MRDDFPPAGTGPSPAGTVPEPPSVLAVAGAAFVVFWLLLLVLFAAPPVFFFSASWAGAFRGSLILWLPWMIVSPAMLAAAHLLPPRFGKGSGPGQWLLFLGGHLAVCVALMFAAGWLMIHILPKPPHAEHRPPPPQEDQYAADGTNIGRPTRVDRVVMDHFLQGVPISVPLYVASLLLVSVLASHRRALRREQRTAELEQQLSQARLDALRAQLHPHFLFNTLNVLAEQIHTAPDQAEEIVLSLGNLLRAALDTRNKTRIPLRQEAQLARDYLGIQKIRHGRRLRVEEEIPAETLSCAVPPLILQPLLENAVKYAVEECPGEAVIRFRASRIEERLVVEIEDSGADLGPRSRSGHGIGIENVRTRLEASYPGLPVRFDLLPNRFGGITARIEIPVVSAL